MRVSTSLPAFVASLAALVVNCPARAQETHAVADAIDLHPARCLERDKLAARAITWLGRDRIDKRVRVKVDEAPSRAVDLVVLRDEVAVAERHLQPKAIPCADLQAAVGLAIALSIDATFLQELMGQPVLGPSSIAMPPVAAPSPSAGEPVPATIASAPSANPASSGGTAPTQPGRPNAAPAPPPPAEPVKSNLGFGVSAMAYGLFGVMPSTALAGAFGAELTWPMVDVRLSGWGTWGSSSTLGAGEVDVGMAAARGEACARKPMGRWTGFGCAGLMAGRWVARGVNYQENYAPALAWLAASMRIEARYEVGYATAVAISVDGFLPLVRPQLQVLGTDGTVAASLQAPAAGWGLGVGPVLTFF